MTADRAATDPPAPPTARPPGRRFGYRQAWARDGYAHIEACGAADEVDAAEAARIEQHVEAVPGVRWAAWNGPLRRLVVRYDPVQLRLAELVRAVADAERRAAPTDEDGAPELDETTGHLIALAGDLVGTGIGLLGRALRLPPLPHELAAATSAFDIPRLRRGLRRLLGDVGADLGLALASSAISAATQRPTASLTDAALRAALLAESAAYRDGWARRAAELHPDRESSRADGPTTPRRPRPLEPGPIERFAERMGTVTLIVAGALAPLPGGASRAAHAVTSGSPRGAQLGREAYAAQLGRVLARRGVLVRDPAALRRLDRIDTVIIDAPALATGRTVITHLAAVRGTEEEARERATRLLAERAPARRADREGWRLTAPARLGVPVPAELFERLGGGRGDVLALADGPELVALLRVEVELDPLATAVAATARRVGRLLVAGAGPDVVHRVRADGRVPGGSRLAESVRREQRGGHGVLLIATRNDTALAAADCGIGVLAAGGRPTWGAHLLCGPDLESVWLALEAVTVARQVSGRAVRLSLLGSAAGALLGILDNRPTAGRSALLANTVATLTNLAYGAYAAQKLARRPRPAPEDPVPWHALAVDDVLQQLETSPDGLSEEQAAHRRGEQDEENDEERPRGLLSAVIDELDTPLTAPLAAGAGVSAAGGSTVDAALVLSVIIANALLSGVQQVSAGRTLRQLLTATALPVRLRRATAVRDARAEELVPGDLVVLQPGDAVPADCRLIEAVGLEMDESNLTGESAPVPKSASPTEATAVAERNSMVYAGTTVAAGTATAVVVATGRATEAGRGAQTGAEDAPTGGVQARLQKMVNGSVRAAAVAAAGVLGSGLLRGRIAESINSSVALAVAAMPEGLPFVATAAQLAASKRLCRRNILVRDPRALEALGRADVICFDKTGTLTEGRIGLHCVSDGEREAPIDELPPPYRSILAVALRATPPPDGDAALPHPTDQAVVDGARAASVSPREGADGWQARCELPFEPGRGFHAVLGALPEAGLISVKGAPEVVLPRCVSWRRDGQARPLGEAERAAIRAETERLAEQGLRVLAVAERVATDGDTLSDEDVAGLELRGLLGLADTPRENAAEAVRRLRRAGVSVVMLTGDHPTTAGAVAARLDLLGDAGVVTGAQLDAATESELDELVAGARVFARVSPAQKVSVVRSLRRLGHVVAVTGDGANDAPAIRLADVGIALGDHGATAARQAADLIVADGRIETIAEGVVEGRAMWVAVRDAVALLLGGNLGEIMFNLGASTLTGESPLNTRQLLFVNLLTDLLPAITVAARQPRGVSAEQLAREGPDASLGSALNRDVAQRAAATALAATGGWFAARLTGTRARAGTVALASLVASQLVQTAIASRGDPAVLAATGVSLAALVGTVQTPLVSGFFGCRPLGPLGWGIALASAASGGVAGALRLSRVADVLQVPGRTTG